MSDERPDLIDELNRLQQELSPDDERRVVIESLIRDRAAAVSADGAAAPSVDRAGTAPINSFASAARAASQATGLTAGQAAGHPVGHGRGGLKRYPQIEVRYLGPPGGFRQLARLVCLVAAIAVGTSMAVLILAGAISRAKRPPLASAQSAAQPVSFRR